MIRFLAPRPAVPPKSLVLKHLLSAVIAATASAWPAISHANVVVEQIEAFEDPKDPTPTEYAPINFNGVTPVTVTSGDYNGITFHAEDAITNTYSAHADVVADRIYGLNSAAHPFVTNVYAAAADLFIPNVVNPNPPSRLMALPQARSMAGLRLSTTATSITKPMTHPSQSQTSMRFAGSIS